MSSYPGDARAATELEQARRANRSAPLRVLMATSWDTACGIAAFAEMAKEYVEAADPNILMLASAQALDPLWARTTQAAPHVLWLNYHRGLHSRWTPEAVTHWKRDIGTPVVITFHDTYGESEPDALTQELHDLADAFIVHEPCVGLPKQILIRQGVLPYMGVYQYETGPRGWSKGRPILGTAGFNFPWKSYDDLAKATAAAGWALLILSNNATEEDGLRWASYNPACQTVAGFLSGSELVTRLAGCDATAVMYQCANSGTSGAVRLCLAARKPIFATGCRQWRDLMIAQDLWGVTALRHVERFARLPLALATCPIQRLDPAVQFVAEQDSWVKQGARYASVFREVAR